MGLERCGGAALSRQGPPCEPNGLRVRRLGTQVTGTVACKRAKREIRGLRGGGGYSTMLQCRSAGVSSTSSAPKLTSLG
jgi:hypothetical protein